MLHCGTVGEYKIGSSSSTELVPMTDTCLSILESRLLASCYRMNIHHDGISESRKTLFPFRYTPS